MRYSQEEFLYTNGQCLDLLLKVADDLADLRGDHQDPICELPLLFLREPGRRRRDPNGRHYRPVAVANRRGNTPHSVQVLRFVRSETLSANALALRGQRSDALDGV